MRTSTSRPRSAVRRVLGLVGVTIAVSSGAAVARAVVADDGILNQTEVQDATGESGGGADLSSLSVTTWTDGTVSLSVRFGNRSRLHPHESMQVFVDLDDDGRQDLNLSLWPTGLPSYLARWAGTDWVNVRQLYEAVQTDGSYAIRLRLGELRDAAGVPIGSQIGVLVGTWTADPATGKLRKDADDWLPDSHAWIKHRVEKPAATSSTSSPPPTATTSSTTTPSVARPASPSLALACVRGALRATVTPAKGSKVASVSFYVNGKLRAKDAKAPYVAAIPTRGLHGTLTIGATIRLRGETQILNKQAPPC